MSSIPPAPSSIILSIFLSFRSFILLSSFPLFLPLFFFPLLTFFPVLFLSILSSFPSLLSKDVFRRLPGAVGSQLEWNFGALSGSSSSYQGAFLYCVAFPCSFLHQYIEQLLSENPKLKDVDKAQNIIRDYVNEVCAQILYNVGVFKKDKDGVVAFNKFLDYCGLKLVN